MAINEDKARNLLLRSLEEELSPAETAELQAALDSLEGLRREHQQLVKMRRLLEQLQPEASAAFTGKVMEQLQQRKKEARIITWTARLAAACLLIIALALFSLYWSEGSLDTDALLGLESLAPDDAVTLLDY